MPYIDNHDDFHTYGCPIDELNADIDSFICTPNHPTVLALAWLEEVERLGKQGLNVRAQHMLNRVKYLLDGRAVEEHVYSLLSIAGEMSPEMLYSKYRAITLEKIRKALDALRTRGRVEASERDMWSVRKA